MNLQFHAPPEVLAPFVRRFIVSDYTLKHELVLHPWPTGNIYVIWFFGDLANYSVSKDGEPHDFRHPIWLAGQTEYHRVRVAIRERTSAVVAELTPLAFWRLTSMPGRWLTGRTAEFGDFSPRLGRLADRYAEGGVRKAEDCLARMQAFLVDAAHEAQPTDVTIEGALAAMASRHGRIAIADLARRAGVTQRHLTRRFHDLVGLTPKFYGRILQVNQVIEMRFLPDSGSIAGVACEAGYYDQAHLNHAMKLFVSEGPSAFLRSDHLLFRTFLEQQGTQAA